MNGFGDLYRVFVAGKCARRTSWPASDYVYWLKGARYPTIVRNGIHYRWYKNNPHAREEFLADDWEECNTNG